MANELDRKGGVMNNLTLNDLAKLEREASAEQVDPNDYICARCGADYSLTDGCEPTPLCHSCAHAFVADAARFLPLARRALEQGERQPLSHPTRPQCKLGCLDDTEHAFRVCGECNGTGQSPRECEACNGSGECHEERGDADEA